MKQFFSFFLLMIGFSSFVKGQESYKMKVQSYIEKYKDWAIHEQIRSGVPASITLAQGILETAAGESELANNANNHFGIKCKKTWNGQTYAYTDDAKDECFRKYDSAYYSYRDHSDFLKTNPRYSILFSYSLHDYKSWAHGLKKCGYATNPVYAQKLIKFIEEYDLNSYTIEAINPIPEKRRMLAQLEDEGKINENAVEIKDHSFESLGFGADGDDSTITNSGILEYYVTTKKNGLSGFYAKAGDLLLEYSLNSKIRYSKLLAWNDLMDKPLENTMFIYTEAKRKKGLRPTHVVQKEESLHMISQEEGIQLNQLLTLNRLSEDDRPEIGSVLFLQSQNPGKVTLSEEKTLIPAHLYSNEKSDEGSDTEDEFISTDHSRTTLETEDQKKEAEFVATLKVDSVDSEGNKELVSEDAGNVELKEVEDYSLSADSPNASTEDQKNAQVKVEDEKELTPLEKLKQYMDNTVYLETEEKEVAPQTEKKQTDIKTTLPAGKQKVNSQVQTAQTTAKSAQPTYHIVKKGETAFKISKHYNITLSQLKQWNQLPASMVVTVGQKLKVKP